jgi:hypothetical protein
MDDTSGAKTKSLGYVSKDKLSKLGKVWTDYEAASEAFAKAKIHSAKTKDAVKAALKKHIKNDGDIDFTVEEKRVRIFENLTKSARAARGADLDDMF